MPFQEMFDMIINAFIMFLSLHLSDRCSSAGGGYVPPGGRGEHVII